MAFWHHKIGGGGLPIPPYEAYAETHKKSSNQRKKGVKRPLKKTARTIGECYTADSYRRAITRACEKAEIPVWTPYQLRHNYGDRVDKEFDRNTARAALGHADFDATEWYVESDLSLVEQVARQIG